MRSLSTPFYRLITVFFFVAGFTACRAPLTEENLARLTDLQELVSSAQNNLSWDEQDLQQRVDSMNRKMQYLSSHMKDSGDLRVSLITYQAIKANYDAYLEQAPALEYDLDKYRAEIVKLKEDALSGKISNSAFEKKYSELRPPLTIIAKTTEPLWHNVLSLEPEYMRHNKVITERWRAMGGR